MQNEVETGQVQAGRSNTRGEHAGADAPALAVTPAVHVDGVVRKLASTARRLKPLARPELKIATANKTLREPPASASLRSMCPPVLDQDPIQSCAAFAFTSALRFLHMRDGQDECLSPLFCYYATRVLIEKEQNGDDSGCKADAVVEALENYGVCVESLWPYDTAKFAVEPPASAFDDAVKRKLAKVYRVTTLRAMKVSIADGYPVPVAFPVARSVGYGSDAVLSPTWRTGVFPVPTAALGDVRTGASSVSAGSAGGSVGSAGRAVGSGGGAVDSAGGAMGSGGGSVGSAGKATGYAGGPVNDMNPFHQPASDLADGYHFVLAIGYDDATGLVESENSWGPTFGDNGYGYLPYALFGPTQDTLIADPSVLAEDPWTVRFQSDEARSATHQ
ncbi:C1 family peptidase [Caballeronia sordidicola]|uniref:C1 family peptidase n=1 Tax=Caballeronia sordidicola TaxID=196367 RepID=UPI000A3C8F47|nr:C1 family peptidase [Caballeronia sordidicola]